MNKFNKLSRAEMKKIVGGSEKYCDTDHYCLIYNPQTRVLDPGGWCSVPISGTGCQCYNPDWDSYGDVNYCYDM
jgi:hypothetical protein